MVEFQHVIASREALHARPVTQVAACVMGHASAVSIACSEASASGSDLLGLMSLHAKQGDTLTVQVEGPDEHEAACELKKILQENV